MFAFKLNKIFFKYEEINILRAQIIIFNKIKKLYIKSKSPSELKIV